MIMQRIVRYAFWVAITTASIPFNFLSAKNSTDNLIKAAEKVTSPVSKATQSLVKKLQKELGMHKGYFWGDNFTVEVKESSALQDISSKEFVVISYPAQNKYIILLHETWFNSFSLEAKRFIIGHELIHIKHRHNLVSSLLSDAFPTMKNASNSRFDEKPWYDDDTKKLFLLWYSRCCEKDADISCAKQLHCAQGGIEVFEKLEKDQGTFFKASDIYTKHPSHKERIKYLKELAASAEYKALCAA